MKYLKRAILVLLAVPALTQCNSQSIPKEMNTTVNQDSTKVKEIIVDVRSTEEWNYDGHANCSVNYPLDQFESKIEELKKYGKVTIVCRSGNRAGIAKRILENAGFKNVVNLGAWQNVDCAE